MIYWSANERTGGSAVGVAVALDAWPARILPKTGPGPAERSDKKMTQKTSRGWRRIGGTAAALGVAAVLAFPASVAAEESSGIGSLMRDWFGVGESKPSKSSTTTKTIDARGTETGGILFRGLDAGERMAHSADEGGAILDLRGAGEELTWFTPRADGLRLGLGVSGSSGVGGEESRAIDLAVAQSISDFEVTASVGFADRTGATLLHQRQQRSSFATGLQVGYGGFLVGGGVRLVSPVDGRDESRRVLGIGAGYTSGDFAVSASYIRGRDLENADGDDTTGFTFSGRYSIVPGIQAHAAGYYGDTADGAAGAKSGDNSVAIVGGIALSF